MTPYRERREAGEYDAPGTEQANDVEDNGAPRTLAELKAEAEEQGLPTYGTKAQLEARLAEA